MDWIEKLFGVSPDGGNGSFEAVFLTGLVALVVLGGTVVWRALQDTTGDVE